MRQNQKTRKEENQKLLQNREIHEQTRQQTIQRKKQEEKEREDEEFVTEKMRRRKIKNNEEEREASQNERERTREKKPQPSKKAKREHKKQLDGVKKRPVPSEQEMIKQPKKDQRVRSEEAFSKKKQEKDMVRQDEAAKRVSQLSKDASKKKVKKESNFEVQFATYSYDTALKIIQQLKTVYLKDVKANKNDEIAWHRIQHLPILRERLLNYEVKRVFLEKGGLEELLRWLLPTPHKVKNEEEEILIEPALAVKMAVLRILLELQLTPQQITEHGIYIHATLTKNQKNSKIPALRELCSKILRSWDFTMFKQLSQHFKNKSK